MDAFIAFLRDLTAADLKNGNSYFDKDGCRFWAGLSCLDWGQLRVELKPGGGEDSGLFVTKIVDTDLWWGWEEEGDDNVRGMKKVKIDLFPHFEKALLIYGYHYGNVTIDDESLRKVIDYVCRRIENWDQEEKEKVPMPFWCYKGFKGFVN